MVEQQMPVQLREVHDADVDTFFAQLRDPEAAALAYGVMEAPNERSAFDAHWRHLRANSRALVRTITLQGDPEAYVVGHIRASEESDERRIAFWIDRNFWGQGITTRAVQEFLSHVSERPLTARVPRHNAAAVQVLRKNGFMHVGAETGFNPDRGRVVDELVLRHA